MNTYTETALFSLAQQILENAREHVADERSQLTRDASKENHDDAMIILFRCHRDVEDSFSRHLSRWAR